MAKIQTQGTVTRIISERGFVVTESYTGKDGKERNTKFTVWCPAKDIPSEGSTVTVTGLHSVKVETFKGNDGREITYAAQHINNPAIIVDREAAPAVEQAPENWPSTLSMDAPF
jgi:hypothetical protein